MFSIRQFRTSKSGIALFFLSLNDIAYIWYGEIVEDSVERT